MDNYILETITVNGHSGFVSEAWEHPNAVMFEETENIDMAKLYSLDQAKDLAKKMNQTCNSPRDTFFVIRRK